MDEKGKIILDDEAGSDCRSAEIPWPSRPHGAIMPVFLPFQGCPQRCCFCAQDRQTGTGKLGGLAGIRERLEVCRHHLVARKESGLEPLELAFYGATFTALNPSAWQMCIDFARDAMHGGLITSYRCSTRPDCLFPERLKELAKSGCGLIELGIQSFCDEILVRIGRGYVREVGIKACENVLAADMRLCVHLMPGLPGMDRNVFLEDVNTAIEQEVSFLRFHPCLVLKDTVLAIEWQKGRYMPWSLTETVDSLAFALSLCQRKRVPVIRIGLAPEPDLYNIVLAGPVHPALGAVAMSHAILITVQNMLDKMNDRFEDIKNCKLYVPMAAQGYFWGHNAVLRGEWKKLGVGNQNLVFWEKENLRLEVI